MSDKAGEVRPLRIPPLDAPGYLDTIAVRRWADLLVAECRPRLAETAALAAHNISCTGSILHSTAYWQRPADATLLTVAWGTVAGSIAIPMSLALPLVARCLGYETPSDLPLDALDYEVLGAWLRPVTTWVQTRAGLDGVTVSPAADTAAAPTDSAPGNALLPQTEPVVLLQLSISVGPQQGTWHLLIPWEPLREPLRREALQAAEEERVEPAGVGGIEIAAEVIIAGGAVPLRDSLRLGVGDVVALDCEVTSGVELRVGDHAVATGRLGANKGRWAVRVSEMHWASKSGARRGGRQ